MPQSLLLYCRAGFESEAASEIKFACEELSAQGFVRAKKDSAYAVFEGTDTSLFGKTIEGLDFASLVFARQLIYSCGVVNNLPDADRITPLLAAFQEHFTEYFPDKCISAVFVETADTNEAKELQTFCKSFSKPLAAKLSQKGWKVGEANAHAPAFHILFLSAQAAYVGISFPNNASRWPMGIVRLKFPSAAPSRSTLKLEEAFSTLLSPFEREKYLRAGMRSVDLGAAPGGWTYQLVRRSLHVTAIDNGPMDSALLASGLVEHLRTDGFKFRPKNPVDWMVCDMVEQPSRIAQLVADWFEAQQADHIVFNLKLPMKNRASEVKKCLDMITQSAEMAGRPFTLRCKQLYHDREEVTAYLGVR